MNAKSGFIADTIKEEIEARFAESWTIIWMIFDVDTVVF